MGRPSIASDADAKDGNMAVREPGDDCREVDVEETGDVGSAYGMIEVSQETLSLETKHRVSLGPRFVFTKDKGDRTVEPLLGKKRYEPHQKTRRPDPRRAGDRKRAGENRGVKVRSQEMWG